MNLKVIVYGFVTIFLISQVVECKDSRVMKYGKLISSRFIRYTKPLLVGTERSAGKLTRDVGVASKFTARNMINGMIVANKGLISLLQLTKNKFFKKKGGDSPPPAAAAPPPPPEETPESVPEPSAEPAAEPAADEPTDSVRRR